MPKMTGKKALMEALIAEGTEYIFGNPGTSETAIMDEMESYPQIKYKLVMQEGVAMGMADAYARATLKPSFVNLHIETGLANGLSLLHNAKEGGTPMVLTAGNLDIRESARGRTKLTDMTDPFTKFSEEATHPEQIPSLIRRAFMEAKTPPTGPTFVAFSANSLDHTGEMDIYPSPQNSSLNMPDPESIEKMVDLITKAKNPIIIVGDRVSQSRATSELTEFAEMIGARVYSSIYSEMNFPSTHPQYLGGIRLGFPETNQLFTDSDVIIAFGKLNSGYYMFSKPDLRFFPEQTKLVHIDVDISGVGTYLPTDIGITSDPKNTLIKLIPAIENTISGTYREEVRGRNTEIAVTKNSLTNSWKQLVKNRWGSRPISAERLMTDIAASVPTETIIVNDAVTSGTALLNAFNFENPDSVYGGRGGALGWGIGGALGIKLANPNKPVVAIIGDGSAMMTIQGLWTAANENLPIVYVICNNSTYRILKLNMNLYKNHVMNEEKPESQFIGMDFPIRPNFVDLAEGMGVHGQKISDPSKIKPAINDAINYGGPVLIDAIIDGTV